MRLSPRDSTLIANALYDKAKGNRDAVRGLPVNSITVQLALDAARAEQLACAFECGEIEATWEE
jgi:hypothetical protein